jgi:hypothetical protein
MLPCFRGVTARRVMRFGILGFLIFAIAFVTDARADQRVALVIGNSAYQNVPKLPNPVNDARAVTALFKRAGFDVVESRPDLGISNLKRALRDFTDLAAQADVAVVYYAGHGMEVDGNNYLVPVDAVLERDVDVEDETVSVDRVMKALEPVKRLRLVILDACRDNPFTRSMKRTMNSRSIGRGLAKVEVLTSDTLIAFAAKAGSTAMDGDGKNSPFTSALLKHLATPGLDVRLALGRVRDDVMKATSNRQEPFVYGSLGGSEVPLVPPADSKVAAPAEPPHDSLADMRRDYEFFERVGTKDAWEEFLQIYPSGPYAVLARQQMAKLSAAEKIDRARPPPTENIGGSEKPADPTSTPFQIATAPADVAISRPAVPPAPGEITRLLQVELRRVGCLTGSTEGSWNADSRRALESFNKFSGTQLDAKVASIDALDAVKLKQSRVCPLECERGYRANGESCVKAACQSGYVLDDDGDCVRARERTAKRRSIAAEPEKPRAQARPRQRAAAGGGGSAHLSCGPGGCQGRAAGCSAHASLSGGWLHGSVYCR